MRHRFVIVVLTLLPALGCGPRDAASGFGCTVTQLAGATLLLDQFSIPRRTLSVPPSTVPDILPVRVSAGPAFRGRVGLSEAGWTVTTESVPDTMATGGELGFGVLVVGSDDLARGVMLFSGPQVQDAPVIGNVRVGTSSLPLLGLQTDVTELEDPSCPFFPDSLGRP